MDKDIASSNPDVVKKMFDDYVIKDAGGPCPIIDRDASMLSYCRDKRSLA